MAPQKNAENAARIIERFGIGVPDKINFGFHLAKRIYDNNAKKTATDKLIEFDGIYIYSFKDGKLVERSGKRDMFKLMRQLGAGSQSK